MRFEKGKPHSSTVERIKLLKQPFGCNSLNDFNLIKQRKYSNLNEPKFGCWGE